MIDLNDHLKLIPFFRQHRKFRSHVRHLGVEDAEQTIALGLAHAAQKFDEKLGKFSTYAFFWVRHELMKAVRLNSTVGCFLSSKHYAKIRSTPLEDMDSDTYWRHLTSTFGSRSFSLDSPVSRDSHTTKGELEALDEQDETAERSLIIQSLLDMADLSEKELLVLRGRFFQDKTLREIGDPLGLSRERVRQIEAAALDKIREVAFV